MLVWAQNVQMLFAYAAINGFMIGGQGTLLNVAWASYFGRQHVGAIRGLTTPVGQVVGSFSPMFADGRGHLKTATASHSWFSPSPT